MNNHPQPSPSSRPLRLSEDWLAVLIAFGLIVLAAIGIIGKSGIPISF